MPPDYIIHKENGVTTYTEVDVNYGERQEHVDRADWLLEQEYKQNATTLKPLRPSGYECYDNLPYDGDANTGHHAV